MNLGKDLEHKMRIQSIGILISACENLSKESSHIVLDFQPTEMWDIKGVLLEAPKFGVICYTAIKSNTLRLVSPFTEV